jgi:uncharacterized membrane protein
MKTWLSIIVLVGMFQQQAFAAGSMEELMFSSGKIYNAITVAMVVLVGVFLYLVKIDRKVSKLEKDMKES